jgi:hypothetical protein
MEVEPPETISFRVVRDETTGRVFEEWIYGNALNDPVYQLVFGYDNNQELPKVKIL